MDMLIKSAATKLTGHQKRIFLAEVTIELCEGSSRSSERRFGWGRETIDKGIYELENDCILTDNFYLRGKKKLKKKIPS